MLKTNKINDVYLCYLEHKMTKYILTGNLTEDDHTPSSLG